MSDPGPQVAHPVDQLAMLFGAWATCFCDIISPPRPLWTAYLEWTASMGVYVSDVTRVFAVRRPNPDGPGWLIQVETPVQACPQLPAAPQLVVDGDLAGRWHPEVRERVRLQIADLVATPAGATALHLRDARCLRHVPAPTEPSHTDRAAGHTPDDG